MSPCDIVSLENREATFQFTSSSDSICISEMFTSLYFYLDFFNNHMSHHSETRYTVLLNVYETNNSYSTLQYRNKNTNYHQD